MSWVAKVFRSIEQGSAEVARSWVDASELEPEAKASLRAFLSRFSDASFARPTAAGLDAWAEQRQIHLPSSARATLAAMPFVDGPDVELRLDAFGGWAPTADEVSDTWYRLHFAGAVNDEDRALLDSVDLFPIAEVWGTHHSHLALDLASDGAASVYEYAIENLRDNVAEGKDAADSVYCVFDSLFELLDHVVEVRVIEA